MRVKLVPVLTLALLGCAVSDTLEEDGLDVVVVSSLDPRQRPQTQERGPLAPLSREQGLSPEQGPRDVGPLRDRTPLPPPRDQEPACVAMEESPDGLDNDCDGRVDEDTQLPCPRVEFDGRNYFFCHPEELSWEAARDECARWGYQLVSINRREEQDFIVGERSRQDQENLWIGLSDRAQEGRFVWLDGNEITFSAWDDGEPNDGGDGGEDCVAILREDGRVGRWDARQCDAAYDYTCESP